MTCWPACICKNHFLSFFPLFHLFLKFLFPYLLICKRSIWTVGQHYSHCLWLWIVLVGHCLSGMMIRSKGYSSPHVLGNLPIDFTSRYWEDSQRKDQAGAVAVTCTLKGLQKIGRLEIFASAWLVDPPKHHDLWYKFCWLAHIVSENEANICACSDFGF